MVVIRKPIQRSENLIDNRRANSARALSVYRAHVAWMAKERARMMALMKKFEEDERRVFKTGQGKTYKGPLIIKEDRTRRP